MSMFGSHVALGDVLVRSLVRLEPEGDEVKWRL